MLHSKTINLTVVLNSHSRTVLFKADQCVRAHNHPGEDLFLVAFNKI